MKLLTLRSTTGRLVLTLLIAATVSACSYQQKHWKMYNEQLAQLPQPDKDLFLKTVQQTLETSPSNTQVSWLNSQGDVSGTITPVRTVQKNSGVYCRVYEATFQNNTSSSTTIAAACRNTAGIWDATHPGSIRS